MKFAYFLFAILPLLTQGHDKLCTSLKGYPISGKPFAIPGNCDGFYQCSGGHLTQQNCAPGTVFNPALRVCDWPHNVPQCKLNTVIACEDVNGVTASCPSGSVIVVKDGFYGRDDDSSTCPHSKIKTTSCSADGSLDILKDKCNGKTSCDLEATNSAFGDPCQGTYKYIKLQFYCKRIPKRASNWHKLTICEDSSKTLSCPAGQVILVSKGYYGRDDGTTCPHKSIKTTSCSADGSLDKIRATCNGKSTCTIQAKNSVFGDPCVNTYKYVEMTYVCKRPSRWRALTVCEDHSKTITCPTSQVIWIKSGYYGRDDGNTCPHQHIKTTTCSADGSLQTLKGNCNGKNSCTVTASNSVFSDPCYGTYKYVEMVYTCRKNKQPCYDKKGNPISSLPFKKPGDCGHFYQCSNGYLYTHSCPDGTVFNPKLRVCDWPNNVPGCN